MDELNANDLDAILATLRKHGVASAEVPFGSAQIRVVFEPAGGGPLPPGDPVTPGGWKGPGNLDQPMADEERVP